MNRENKKHLMVQIVGYIFVLGFLSWFGYQIAPESSNDVSGGPLILAIALTASLMFENMLHKAHLRKAAWSYVSNNYPYNRPADGFPLAGPLISSDVRGLSYRDVYEVPTTGGALAYLTQVDVQRNMFGNSDEQMGEYILSYLVMAVEFNVPTPHIFIDGRSQNHFGKKTTDLWSLTKRLDRHEKIGDLEGDFYKFFDVYTADREYLSALTIVTPDVMLALRDKGYSFDYEIHDGHLYVMHESQLSSVEEMKGLIDAMQACLSELIPQITKHSYDDAHKELVLHTGRLHLTAFMLGARIVGKYFLKAIVFMIIGIIIGGMLHSI